MAAAWLILELVLGGLVGAVALSVLTVLSHWFFVRRVFGDGQYFLVFVGTIPAGAVLGAVTALAIGFRLAHAPQVAAWIAIVGDGATAVLCALAGWFLLSTENPGAKERLGGIVFEFGAALVWALALVGWGLWLLLR